MNPAKEKKFGIGIVEIIKQVGISPERLRYWERLGIVKPKYLQCGTRKFRRYSQEDIDRVILVKKLVDEEKYTLSGAMMKLKEKIKETEDDPDEEKYKPKQNDDNLIKCLTSPKKL